MKLIQSSFVRALRASAVTAAAAASMLAASASHAADPAYFNKYDGMRMSRDAAGVLLVEMNTKGGPLKFSAREHEQFVDAFYDSGRDRDNKIVVLTGAGGQWMGDIDFPSFGNVNDPDVWSKVHDEGTQIVENIANIRVPMICAVEGKAWVRLRDRQRVPEEAGSHPAQHPHPFRPAAETGPDSADWLWPEPGRRQRVGFG